MYNIEFYSTADGASELWDFLNELQQKALTSKDARIQHNQIALYIQLLQDHGTQLGENIMFSFTTSRRKPRKRRVVRLNAQRRNEMIGWPERSKAK